MPKVRDVMSKGVSHVDVSATVLDAVRVINQKESTGVAVFQDDKPIGMLTERSILRRFVELDKRPSEVHIREVMTPLLKISADASVKEAAKTILENRMTRLGVFDNDKLVGWVTITDIARESSKKTIVDTLLGQGGAGANDELLCPNCRSGVMKKVIGAKGKVLRWECPRCQYEE